MTYCMYDFDLGKWLHVFESSSFCAASLIKNIIYCYVYSHADTLFLPIIKNPLVYVNVILIAHSIISIIDILSAFQCSVAFIYPVSYSCAGYVQGMSDLLSPILFVMENEVDAFWCFVSFMDEMVMQCVHYSTSLFSTLGSAVYEKIWLHQ